MRKVTIEVSGWDAVETRMKAAFQGVPQGEFISFVSMELFWKTLSPRRLELLRALTGRGPISQRAAAKLLGRDVKTVHGDALALLKVGILEKSDEGKIVFPYDAVHVDFSFGMEETKFAA